MWTEFEMGSQLKKGNRANSLLPLVPHFRICTHYGVTVARLGLFQCLNFPLVEMTYDFVWHSKGPFTLLMASRGIIQHSADIERST